MTIVKKWFGTWITPKEGLPTEAARVLIEHVGGQMNSEAYDVIVSGYFTTEPVRRFISDRGWYIDIDKVVAWMLLPEPIRQDRLSKEERATLMRAEIESIERRAKGKIEAD